MESQEIEPKKENLKELAESLLVRSVDDVSNDREIIEKIKDKLIFIKESNKIDVIYKTNNLQDKIALYLIGKVIGFKILHLFDKPTASTNEIALSLNVTSQALAPSLGALTKELIEKEKNDYKIKAYTILDFIKNLDDKPILKTAPQNKNKKRRVSETKNEQEIQLKLKENGLKGLSEILKIEENNIRKIFFIREDDLKLIDSKFINKDSNKDRQLEFTLVYLIGYKYLFDLEECPATILRKKLQLAGVKSLVNLTTNLHKFSEFIIHDAGRKGSTKNNFIITQPGETKIKNMLKDYFNTKGTNGD